VRSGRGERLCPASRVTRRASRAALPPYLSNPGWHDCVKNSPVNTPNDNLSPIIVLPAPSTRPPDSSAEFLKSEKTPHPDSLPVRPRQVGTLFREGISRRDADQCARDARAPHPIPQAGRGSRGVDWIIETEPWPEAVNGNALLDELADVVRRYVVLPVHASNAVALWVLHTHAFELRDISAYLGIESPEKRCGKTTLLSLLAALVNRPVVASNISPSAIFRAIEEVRPTLLIDEADTLLRGNDEFRGMLNAGYGRGTAFVVRVAPEGPAARGSAATPGTGVVAAPADVSSRLARFSCWCPKAIAAIGQLPETLADRCIRIRMQRKAPGETCERLRNLDPNPLRRQCARFVADSAAAIAAARPSFPEGLNDRTADIWEPLFVLADLAGGPWPGRAREAALDLAVQTEGISPIAELVHSIYISFLVRLTDRMFTRDLVRALQLHAENASHRAWPRGKITDMWLAQQLRPYDVRSRSIRIGNEKGNGYLESDLEEIFRRYIPPEEGVDSGVEFRS
jgi:Protein of unknown function (DUF3631)